MAYCSDQVSRKLRIISFLATISVVIIHTNYLEGCIEMPLAWWTGNLIAYLQRWAVPVFFVISGFFIVREFDGREVFPYFKVFLAKKSKAIMLPYILWILGYGLLAMTLLQIGVSFQRGESNVLAHTIFAHWGQWEFFDSILGITHAPLIGAFWYLRVLILIILTIPIWICLFRYARWLGLSVALAMILSSSISGLHHETFALPFGGVFAFKINSLGWILFGMAAGAFSLDRVCVRPILGGGALLLWVISAIWPLVWEFKGVEVPVPIELMHRIHPIFLLVALWWIGDWLADKLPQQLPWVMGMGFWIYCMHHPVTGYVGALGHIVVGRGMAARFVMQFTGWLVTLAICIIIGRFFSRRFPKTYKILCGGR